MDTLWLTHQYGAPFVAKIDDARISTRVNIDHRSQQSIVDHSMHAIDRRSQQSIVDHSNRSSITCSNRLSITASVDTVCVCVCVYVCVTVYRGIAPQFPSCQETPLIRIPLSETTSMLHALKLFRASISDETALILP